FVEEGKVDYAAIHQDPATLENVLTIAKKISLEKADDATRQAFWINAYNLSVIQGVIDVYSIASPLDVEGFFDIRTFELAGNTITLNDIENKKLRAAFGDARFHFVLVCGAKGCPPLISKAYTPENLEMLLQQHTVKALNNPEFIKVTDSEVCLSEIFKWYKEDFVKEGSEINFLNRFRKENLDNNIKICYYPYDWRLNEK
ncbi:MAG: DUF547 domain-containing protein, partial [Marinirhabdus sp.]|nr:DUF547 domain-containing protein [Marinirhabdus sp.]